MQNKITHEGEIKLGDHLISCYVLEDGRRILSGRGMQNALKMVDDPSDGENTYRPGGARLSRYLSQKTLEPYLYKDREWGHYEPITCYKGKAKINGFEYVILKRVFRHPN